jgi:thiamine biosynthesis lipoprotein
MPQFVECQRPAMGTWFVVRLVGDDAEHLGAVAEAVLDEVERVERLLSRFDPRSEIARINREAAVRPVLIDREVLGVLLTCQAGWRETAGLFDVTAGRGTFGAVAIDTAARTVRFEQPGVALDLGAIGKGYALDRGAEIIAAQGVSSAFLQGGTSSALGLGRDAAGRPWTIGVRDPFAPADRATELFCLELDGRGFSCSATRAAGQAVSDVVDPRRGEPLEGLAACDVLARDATRAEVLSTALLCMGKEVASEYAARYHASDRFHIAWVESLSGGPVWDWLASGTVSPERSKIP